MIIIGFIDGETFALITRLGPSAAPRAETVQVPNSETRRASDFTDPLIQPLSVEISLTSPEQKSMEPVRPPPESTS